MSAVTPTFTAGFAASFRLSWKRILRGGRLRLSLIACALILVAAILTRYLNGGEEATIETARTALTGSLDTGFFRLLAFVLPFLFTSGAISDEVENRTLPFVTMRPVSRFALGLAKWSAGAAISTLLIVGSVVILHFGMLVAYPEALVEDVPNTLRIAGSLALLTVYFSAVSYFWSALVPEASAVMAGLHLGVVEWVGAVAPGVVRYISMAYHARQLAGLEPGGPRPDWAPTIEPWIAGVSIASLTVLLLFVGSLAFRSSEYRHASA